MGLRRCRWREVEFVFHELREAILPTVGLKAMLKTWPEITRGLAEPKRKRERQRPTLS